MGRSIRGDPHCGSRAEATMLSKPARLAGLMAFALGALPLCAQKVAAQAEPRRGPSVSRLEYEGWRQYSVNCARCHGQDVLPNPVAANLLISLAPGGPMESKEKFTQVVTAGRSDRGMPAFKSTLTPEQTAAVYAYVKGRADKRIPPGRPKRPG